MGRKITNNLKKYELIQTLEEISNKLIYVNKAIQLNLGKDPVLWRRSSSLVSKVEELLDLVEELDQ